MVYVDMNYPSSVPLLDQSGDLVWVLVVAFIIAFFLAFGVGANDVANSFGTSVGSKVLTLKQACILATIFEVLGAVLLGYNVSNTIRTGMIYVDQYEGESKLMMLGFLAALIGSTIWNLVATLLGMPISGTHSIVGAIIGFSVVAKGFGSVRWVGLIKIVASWFISPITSGVVSLVLYIGIKHFIINKDSALKNGLRALPVFYAATVFINVFSIVHEGPHVLKNVNWWIAGLIALTISITVGLVIWFVVAPKLKAKILTLTNVMGDFGLKSVVAFDNKVDLNTEVSQSSSINDSAEDDDIALEKKKVNGDFTTATTNGTNGTLPPSVITNGTNGTTTKDPPSLGAVHVNGLPLPPTTHPIPGARAKASFSSETFSITQEASKDGVIPIADDDDKPEVAQLFTFLQILTACFGSFAHGANDVSNAIGPLVAVMLIFRQGTPEGDTPWYILLYGGLGISIGLWVWGRRVIETMGNDLTKITPSTGFTIEIGAASTVLIASKFGLPISTTHCKVGSVVMVGKAAGSKQGVNWRLFANIAATWILTVPLTALLSAASMALLRLAV